MYPLQAVKRWRRRLSILAILLWILALAAGMTASAAAQNTVANDIWRDVSERAFTVQGERWIIPAQYRTVSLNQSALRDLLAVAPREESVTAQDSTAIITLPLPDGGYGRFSFVESPIMEPRLAAKFPGIKTYAGQGLDDETATVRFDWTPAGFHAMILSAGGTIFIDPYSRNDVTHYVSYYTRDYQPAVPKLFNEILPGSSEDWAMAREIERLRLLHPNTPVGPQLRTYRLAVAATGEYTQFHGGTVPLGLAAIVTSINRVTGIYEREVAVRMTLVADNDLIVYTNPTTDPYTNNSPSSLLAENQANLDTVIGNANYDVGHVFSTAGGGLAALGVPCRTGVKARGETGTSSPVGDPFDVDYVAHEMGHQFGANHTFNGNAGSCSGNRNASTAYEPGSGSTIMAYAGICGAQDLQPHSDDYFHTISFDEIVAYTNSGSGNTCPVTTNTGNSAPMPNAGSGGQTIPAQTPFTLTGSATDPDGDPLTYNWEEFDLGTAGAPNNPTNPPFFRSFNSTTGPSRTFPKWTDILSNTTTIGEVLPNTTRAMIFRLTVRDNRSGGGGVDRASTTINVTTAAGPFQVTAPNTALTWGTGSVQAVTWNVANTNLAPVNCSTVNVRLSIDGGFNYPIALASGVANNGSAAITVPNNPTTQARVQVACANNIFFDVSNVNFTIVAGTPDFSLTVNPTSQTICIPANAVYSVTAASVNGYTNPVNLSVSGIAAGATANWGMNPVTPTGATTLSIGNTGAFSVGSFPLTVTGQSGALSHSISSTLSILVGAPAQTTLIAPANNAMSQPVRPIFSWSALGQVGTYDIQIATDAGFTNVVAGATGLFTTTFTPGVDLDSGTIYYWRVRGANFCGAGIYSTVYMFTTQSQPTDCSLGMTTNVLYSTNFESGVGGWTHSGTGDTWSLWNTSVRSGTNAFHATDPASTSDQRLVSPPVVLPSGQNPVTLQFWNKQTLENRMGGCYDGGILEISSNGGVTWTQVMSDSLLTDPYDGSISTSFLNPLGGLNAWCGNPQDWLKSVVDVSAYAGQIVQFRFRLGSDSATGRPDGWNIDDVKVQSCLSSPQADLSLSKSVTPTTVLNGELVTYTLAITNGGPDTAANVVLSDVLPVSVTFRSLSAQPGWTCTTPAVGSAGLIKCTQPALPISSTVFTLVAQITGVHSISNTLITNQIIATADTLDPTLPNGASASVTVGGGAPQYQVYLPIVMRDF